MPHSSKMLRNYITRIDQHIRDDESIVQAFEDFPGKSRIQFACDFSEIYSYCDILSNQNISYRRNASLAHNIALNEVYADGLFFRRTPVLLLPSYKLELSTFTKNIATSDVGFVADAIEALQHPGYGPTELLNWLQNLDGFSGGNLARDPIQILSEIYQKAPALMILLAEELRPVARLRALLRRANFGSISDITLDNAEISEPPPSQSVTTHWWAAKLKDRRPDRTLSSNLIDAMAISALQSLNNSSPRNGPFVLVTRSSAMRAILKEHRYSPACRNVYLVHPRIIGSMLIAERAGQSMQSLVTDRYAISVEIQERFESHFDTEDAALDYELRQLVEDVERQWNEIDDVSIAQSLWHNDKELSSLRVYSDKTINQIGEFIRTQNSIRDLINYRAKELSHNVKIENAEIAAIGIANDSIDAKHIVRFQEKSNRATSIGIKPNFVIRAETMDVPYSLQMYDHTLRSMIADGETTKSVLSRFVKSNVTTSDYERLLGIGYLLCSYSEWEIAFVFFSAASRSETEIPKHESLYYCALARRHSAEILDSSMLEQSVSDVVSANKIKRGSRNNKDYWDPRYVNEIGVLMAHNLDFDIGSRFDIRWASPIDAWSDALNAIEHDKLLEAQILNNIVYYSAGLRNPDVDNLSRRLIELEDIVDGQRSDLVSGTILHTIAMANLVLRGYTNEAVATAVGELGHILKLPGLSTRLRKGIEDDLEKLLAFER